MFRETVPIILYILPAVNCILPDFTLSASYAIISLQKARPAGGSEGILMPVRPDQKKRRIDYGREKHTER